MSKSSFPRSPKVATDNPEEKNLEEKISTPKNNYLLVPEIFYAISEELQNMIAGALNENDENMVEALIEDLGTKKVVIMIKKAHVKTLIGTDTK